jgi:hypothetical protein
VDDYLGNVVDFLRESHGFAILVQRPWNASHRGLETDITSGRAAIVHQLSEVPAIVRAMSTKLSAVTKRSQAEPPDRY